MINLTEHLDNSLNGYVFESLGSEKLVDVFTLPNGKMNYIFKTYLTREMQWDKITDGDIEVMETPEARKLAYKKDSNDYIIWLDPQGKFVARSIGNYNVLQDSNFSVNTRGTVKSVSRASDKAIVVLDSDKFSTREIRRIRSEQKKNALALMDAAEVAKNNLIRYQDIIRDNRLSEINMGDIAKSVQDVVNKYGKMIDSITSEIIVSNDLNSVVDRLDDMEVEMQTITNMFKNLLKRKEDYDKYKKWDGILKDDSRNRLLGAVDRLNAQIDKFNEKYVDEQ